MSDTTEPETTEPELAVVYAHMDVFGLKRGDTAYVDLNHPDVPDAVDKGWIELLSDHEDTDDEEPDGDEEE